LHVFANYPYRAVLFIFSMASRVCALHWLAAVCRLSLHEKGKKRARRPKSLIRSSLIYSPSSISFGQRKPSSKACRERRSRAILKSLVSTIAGPGGGTARALWRLTLRGAELFSMPRAVMLSSLLLNHWYHHRRVGLSASARCPSSGDLRPAVRTRIRSRDGGAKLSIRGIRRPFGRPRTVDSAEHRRILRKEDVWRTRVYGQRPHVLRRSENGPGITAHARRG
jgi:hypothetical protein